MIYRRHLLPFATAVESVFRSAIIWCSFREIVQLSKLSETWYPPKASQNIKRRSPSQLWIKMVAMLLWLFFIFPKTHIEIETRRPCNPAVNLLMFKDLAAQHPTFSHRVSIEFCCFLKALFLVLILPHLFGGLVLNLLILRSLWHPARPNNWRPKSSKVAPKGSRANIRRCSKIASRRPPLSKFCAGALPGTNGADAGEACWMIV